MITAREPSIYGATHGWLCDRPCFMFVGVNRVNVV